MKKQIIALLIVVSVSVNAENNNSEYIAAICDKEKQDYACCDNAKFWPGNLWVTGFERIKDSLAVYTVCSVARSDTASKCSISKTPIFEKPQTSRVQKDCILKDF